MERLLAEDEEFRQLKEEHSWFHRKVEELDKKSFLTPEEKLRRDEFKKRKLALKDKMEAIMTAYRRQLEEKD